MKTQTVLLLALSLALSAAGYSAGAHAAQPADHVVINEIEINPPGDDAMAAIEWVEIYNPTSRTVDVGGWEISSTAVSQKTMTIPPGSEIRPGQFLSYSHQPAWFADVLESVELRDSDGRIVDKTPMLTDALGGAASWQRVSDGMDSDSASDWSLAASSEGSANDSAASASPTGPIAVTVDSDKPSYLLGETAVLTGRVSEIAAPGPAFAQSEIRVTVSGPNYLDTVTRYPDPSMGYSVSLGLQPSLGIGEGAYDVTVRYAGSVATTQFEIVPEVAESEEREELQLSLSVDGDSFMPGDTVTLSGFTTEEIPFESLKFNVIDPDGRIVTAGDLFPTSASDRGSVRGGSLAVDPQAQFVARIYVNTVAPVFGTYTIAGVYGEHSAATTYQVVRDQTGGPGISLSVDKDAYEPGDLVVISGRVPHVSITSLDLEVVRSVNLALAGSDRVGGGTGFKILDAVRPEADGTFTYEIPIPESFSSFAEYRVTVSGEIGRTVTKFAIVPDTSEYAVPDVPLFIASDKESYEIGEAVIVSGTVKSEAKGGHADHAVSISVLDHYGRALSVPTNTYDDFNNRISTDLIATAIPDLVGNFEAVIDITRISFSEGAYTVKAEYGDAAHETGILVSDPLNVGRADIVARLDKEIYGFGETLHLTGSFGAQGRDSQGLDITLYKPDGDTDRFGTIIDGSLFSWTWNTPRFESHTPDSNERITSTSNAGTYRISLETGGKHADLYFKVSSDPENDSINLGPVTVASGQAIYMPGDRLVVSGHVMVQAFDSTGPAPRSINIKVLPTVAPVLPIHESNVYPNQGGFYTSTFELPVSIFRDGIYKIRSFYDGRIASAEFAVAGDPASGNLPDLILDVQGDSFYPGQTVTLTGKPSRMVYVDGFDVSIIRQSEGSAVCGTTYCGEHADPPASVLPDTRAEFVYRYDIPETGSLGSYEIVVDAGFGTGSVVFDVVEKPKPRTIIERAHRIADAEITITPEPRSSEGADLIPRVISGSLLTPARAELSGVNLQVASPDGTCIVGQAEGCLVSDSTKTRGSVHRIVEFGGAEYKVRYSGPDAFFEKFSILPASDSEGLPMEPFDVSIVKDGQVSRFYYKVTYVPPQ